MNRPSKKEIKLAVDKLKDGAVGESNKSKKNAKGLPDKKSQVRIRKQGI